MRAAQENDHIVLRGGTYNISCPIWVNKPGLSLSNFNGETPVLSAPREEAANVPQILVINKPRVTVSGLELRGSSYYALKIDVDEAKTPASAVVVRNCRIGGSGADCVKTFNADNLLIENCEIGPSGLRDASNAEGIDSIGSHGVTIRGCFVHDTATTGIYFKGGATDGLIEGCKIHNAGAHGILLGQDTDLEFMRDGTPFEARRCTARGNTVSGTIASGVGTYSGETILFENNILIDVARSTTSGFYVSRDRRGVAAQGVTFNNNTIEMSSARPFIHLIKTQGLFSAQNNVYRYTSSPGPFWIESEVDFKNLGFEAWRTATRTDAGSVCRLADNTL